jgi:hypothetical protein
MQIHPANLQVLDSRLRSGEAKSSVEVGQTIMASPRVTGRLYVDAKKNAAGCPRHLCQNKKNDDVLISVINVELHIIYACPERVN